MFSSIIVLSICVTFGQSITFNPCPGWKDFGIFNGSCYQHFPVKTSWLKANASCGQQGSHLASIHSREENMFVFGMSSAAAYKAAEHLTWLGLRRNEKTKEYEWTDGTDYFYKNWYRPNGGKENVGGIYSGISEHPSEWFDL